MELQFENVQTFLVMILRSNSRWPNMLMLDMRSINNPAIAVLGRTAIRWHMYVPRLE